MQPSIPYTLYARSRPLSVFLGLLYSFGILVGCGLLLDRFPNFPDGPFALLLFGSQFLCFLLAQITCRGKVLLTVQQDGFSIRWLRQIPFFHKADRTLTFDRVKSFRHVKGRPAGSYFIIRLDDNTSYDLCEKRYLFGSKNALASFVADFTAQYHLYCAPQTAYTAPVSPLAAQRHSLDDNITTHRRITFYVSLIIGTLFLAAFALSMIAIGIDEGTWATVVCGVIIFLITYYFISRYFRIAPIVNVTSSGLTCNRAFYMWVDVNSIQLTGTQPMKMFGGKDYEGTKITLNNGSEIILLEGMYTNLGEVRQFIAATVPKLLEQPEEMPSAQASLQPGKGNSPPIPDVLITASADGIRYVKGNHFFNMWGVFAWICVIGAIIGSIAINDAAVTFFFLSFGFGFGLLFTIFINYIGVSDNFVVIRNVYRPWKKKLYAFADIKQVIFASNHNGNNVMRLIFTDFSFKEIVAAGLSDSDWLILLRLLRAKGINVTDENNFEEWVKPEMKRYSRFMMLYVILYFVISLASYMVITSLEVSENMMILLKLLWIVFIILLLIGVMVLVLKTSPDAKKKENTDDTMP